MNSLVELSILAFLAYDRLEEIRDALGGCWMS